jgi:glutathione peroxidase
MSALRAMAFIILCVLSVGQFAAGPARAGQTPPAFTFSALEGGEIALRELAGRPVLVVNTATQCGFAGQFDGMQALYDRYRDRGLVVLAVASDSFRQEVADNDSLRSYCEASLGNDFPMTEITAVRGPGAHPFYRWLAESHGVVPAWNFTKVLIGPGGDYVASWGAMTPPESPRIVAAIESLLD